MANTIVASPAEGLVGRNAELAMAAAAVRGLAEGRASALAIEGEAGIGKTRLVQSIVDDARARGIAVLCGQAHPFERTRPFGVLAASPLPDSNRRRLLTMDREGVHRGPRCPGSPMFAGHLGT